jgi:hypothetical protein
MVLGDFMRLLETGRIELLNKLVPCSLFRGSILPVSKKHIKSHGNM